MTVRRGISLGALLLILLISAGLLYDPSDRFAWRMRLVTWKLTGSLSDTSWPDIYEILTPGNAAVNPEALVSSRNLSMAVTNPFTSPGDVVAGGLTFQYSCARCHGGGDSGAPVLDVGLLRHGSSDWALFRNITHGIPETAMAPVPLTSTETWRVIAFLKSKDKTLSTGLSAQVEPRIASPAVTGDRLVHAGQEPRNWLMYSGSYTGQHYSELDQINATNADALSLMWVYQSHSSERLETTPLAVDGTLYLTEPPNRVVALDAKTGEVIWTFDRPLPDAIPLCCGMVNRGVAILDDTLFLGTLDAHLVALDAATGAVRWDVEVADSSLGYSITAAPLAVGDLVITGQAGGDYATRGFLAAYRAETGEEAWRFQTIPSAGEPGNETWEGDSWRTGGAATWMTGSFDPELNLIYWGIGNPAPDFSGDGREGDNLYSNSVVALDADTGALKWHFQFTPHDLHDWDAVKVPILADIEFMGVPRRVIVWPDRNGFYYLLDRATGTYLLSADFYGQTWADGIGSDGRPRVREESIPGPDGAYVSPGPDGATKWWPASYSPLSHLVYVPTSGNFATVFTEDAEPHGLELQFGGWAAVTRESAAVRALDAATGALEWEFKPELRRVPSSLGGVLSTGGNVVVVGLDQVLYVLNASSGSVLASLNLGGGIVAAPMTYEVQDRQYVAIAAGNALYAFGFGSSTTWRAQQSAR